MTGGLGSFFKKIIPIVMLLCFIGFGLTIIAQGNEITYLRHITTDANGNPLPVPYYEYDFNSYINNIDVNILKRATNNVVDVVTFKWILRSWETIWTDGYQIGDIFASIVNGFIMLIDILITIINIVIIPIRIIAGVILTGYTVVGININSNSVTITSLNALLNSAQIPLIQAFYIN